MKAAAKKQLMMTWPKEALRLGVIGARLGHNQAQMVRKRKKHCCGLGKDTASGTERGHAEIERVGEEAEGTGTDLVGRIVDRPNIRHDVRPEGGEEASADEVSPDVPKLIMGISEAVEAAHK